YLIGGHHLAWITRGRRLGVHRRTRANAHDSSKRRGDRYPPCGAHAGVEDARFLPRAGTIGANEVLELAERLEHRAQGRRLKVHTDPTRCGSDLLVDSTRRPARSFWAGPAWSRPRSWPRSHC